jgi:sulfite oxidase
MSQPASFIVYETDPLNGGPPLEVLRQNVITPNDQFYIRNHGTVPEIDPRVYRLRIEGQVAQPLELSLGDLETFSRCTVAATLQCAGNRRQEMQRIKPIPNEVQWNTEAISHADWSGVLLRDVLERAGVVAGVEHVAFQGSDGTAKAPAGFGGSIPLHVALSTPVLLADTMNGQPLSRAHGYPLRIVVPGYVGARSVKWLSRIVLQRQPSENYYQQYAYRLLPPSATPENVDWDSGLMLGEMPVNSLIWQPLEGERLSEGAVTVRGTAFVGGGRTVERVDVSADGGRMWSQAQFMTEAQPYVWRLWEASLVLSPGAHELIARAWDSGANPQPERVESLWNFKGYMNNAYYRIRVNIIGK